MTKTPANTVIALLSVPLPSLAVSRSIPKQELNISDLTLLCLRARMQLELNKC